MSRNTLHGEKEWQRALEVEETAGIELRDEMLNLLIPVLERRDEEEPCQFEDPGTYNP